MHVKIAKCVPTIVSTYEQNAMQCDVGKFKNTFVFTMVRDNMRTPKMGNFWIFNSLTLARCWLLRYALVSDAMPLIFVYSFACVIVEAWFNSIVSLFIGRASSTREHDIIFQLRQHISKMHLHSWSGMNFILLRRINCCLLLLVLRTMSLRASFLLSMACFCLLTDAYALLNRPDSARHFPMADDAYRWRIHICCFPFLCVFQCNNITFANNNMKLHIRVLPLRLIGFGWFWVSARQNRQQQIW